MPGNSEFQRARNRSVEHTLGAFLKLELLRLRRAKRRWIVEIVLTFAAVVALCVASASTVGWVTTLPPFMFEVVRKATTAVCSVRGCALPLLCGWSFSLHAPPSLLDPLLVTVWVINHFTLPIAVSGVFSEERKKGTLDQLMMIPIPIGQLVIAKILSSGIVGLSLLGVLMYVAIFFYGFQLPVVFFIAAASLEAIANGMVAGALSAWCQRTIAARATSLIVINLLLPAICLCTYLGLRMGGLDRLRTAVLSVACLQEAILIVVAYWLARVGLRRA